MFCPRCGNNNNDLNLWCIRCGYRLEKTENNAAGTVIEGNTVENKSDCPTGIADTQRKSMDIKPKEIKDYMIWSIIMAILGSVAFGVVAVIFSGLTKTELAAGNIEKAKDYSDKSKLFCLISLAVAIVKIIFIVLMLMISIFIASNIFFVY